MPISSRGTPRPVGLPIREIGFEFEFEFDIEFGIRIAFEFEFGIQFELEFEFGMRIEFAFCVRVQKAKNSGGGWA